MVGANTRHPPRGNVRSGTVLVLVVVTIAFVMIAGLIFITSSSTTVGIATVVDDHAQARQIAESGINIIRAYLDRSPDWRDERLSGVWVDGFELLGGRVTISGVFTPATESTVAVSDPSFEQTTASLPTPLLNPLMSGAIGGWDVQRTALVETGLTVPTIGTQVSGVATDGVNQAYIAFGVAITGSGIFSQNLGSELEPHHAYEIQVDIGLAGIPPLSSSYGFRLYAGGTLVVSTNEALSLFDSLTPEEIQSTAENLLNDASEPATLIENLLGGSVSEHTLRFVTGSTPTAGELRLELFAESVGVAASVTFDNIRISSSNNEPLRLTSMGRHGNASHTTSVLVTKDISGSSRIVEWTEP